jgi:hypothetical protein
METKVGSIIFKGNKMKPFTGKANDFSNEWFSIKNKYRESQKPILPDTEFVRTSQQTLNEQKLIINGGRIDYDKNRQRLIEKINDEISKENISKRFILFPDSSSSDPQRRLAGLMQQNSAQMFRSSRFYSDEVESIVKINLEQKNYDFIGFVKMILDTTRPESSKALEVNQKIRSVIDNYYNKTNLSKIEDSIKDLETVLGHVQRGVDLAQNIIQN